MEDFKGSRGPWNIDRNNVHSGQIATVHHCIGNDWVEIWSPDWPDTEEKQEANAKLILSAPELLESLQELFAHYKELADSGDAGNWKLEDEPVGKKAMAAIDKALGK